MSGFRQIIPAKIAIARGIRSRSEIVRESGFAFSEQDLYNWEKGKNLPRTEKIPFLLKGLGVAYEKISKEITAGAGS